MYSSKREEKGRNIQVVVRCRPFNTVERSKAASYGVIDCDQTRKEVVVKTGGVNDKAARKTYTFDMVFGPGAKQIDVYKSVVCPILDEVFLGYNCTVFAYGQTGTGKTFTMEGERSPNEEFTWEEDPLAGVIPRTLHQIFEKLTSNRTEFSVKVSLLEIYNEELFDLLSTGEEISERLQLFDDPRNKRGVVIKGLEEITVHNKDQVYQILERGSAKRKTASTLMNAYSSRSHSVFSVTIHMKEITLDGEELVKIGKLNLVDLAGSENIGRSGAVDKRAREAGNINQSLLTLGRVITALVEKRPHVPYRESKLTRILQDSLGGRTRTSIIATVSPSSVNLEETLSTLEYACRAKNIMNKPEVNQKLTKTTLIKEYTEEIERLKRDLVATRDKNGVFLSAENYENMSGQIATQEEQIAEYMERIAAVEEELKAVTELFVDSKTRLDQCTVDLDEKQQRLEETDRDLQVTKVKLAEEEFISSDLTTTQEALYTTADQLLSTVDASTSDVSGLHAKLDRKREVEQHNSHIQMSFSQRMEAAFSTMQHCVQQQGTKHHGMLNNFSEAMAGLSAMNVVALNEALTTVESYLGGVKQLVVEGVGQVQTDLQQQEALCLNNKASRLQLLEERNRDVEDVLLAQVLPGLSAAKVLLNDTLKATVETTQTLANKMEEMKGMSVFFNSLVQDLATLRESTSAGLNSLQADHDNLSEHIRLAEEKHQTGMNQVIQCLQNQLSLLAMDTKKDYTGLRSISEGMKKPVQSMQQNINTTVESQITAQSDLLSSTCSSLASSLRQSTEETQQMLEESIGQCSHLHSSLTGMGERDVQWFSRAKDQAESQAQERVSLVEKSTAAAQALQQSVESQYAEQLQKSRTDLAQRRGKITEAAGSVLDQASLDHGLLDEHQFELLNHVETGLGEVHQFLEEELKQDVPTGMTPQRREFVYPRVLVKSRNRIELLDYIRGQQEAAMEVPVEEEEEKIQLDLDSLEDEMSTINDTNSSEPSYIDENLVCNDGRVPFFKKKKAGKKDNRITNKSTNEVETTPLRSRLPLRTQN